MVPMVSLGIVGLVTAVIGKDGTAESRPGVLHGVGDFARVSICLMSSGPTIEEMATYSHSGRSTNSLSSMSLWGISSRSFEKVCSSYSRISKSTLRGPLSITLTRPMVFSIACNSSRSSRGGSEVLTYQD